MHPTMYPTMYPTLHQILHPILGLLMLIGVAAFVVFAFRQGMRVRRDDRPDRGGAYGGDSLIGGSHDGGGFGHA